MRSLGGTPSGTSGKGSGESGIRSGDAAVVARVFADIAPGNPLSACAPSASQPSAQRTLSTPTLRAEPCAGRHAPAPPRSRTASTGSYARDCALCALMRSSDRANSPPGRARATARGLTRTLQVTLSTLATIIRLERPELPFVGDGDRILAVITIVAFSTARESAILRT